jgi:hypothetical protein
MRTKIIQIKKNAESRSVLQIITATLMMTFVILGSRYASVTELQATGQVIITALLFSGAIISGYFATTS